MSWTRGHGGTGWQWVSDSDAEMRKTSNGWWQVRLRGGDHVLFSNRSSQVAYDYAKALRVPANAQSEPQR